MRNIMTTDHHAVHMNVMGACGVTKSKKRTVNNVRGIDKTA